MKTNFTFSCAAVIAASLALSACGKKDSASDGGAGGAGSVSSQLDDLRDEIARLEALIEAGEGNQEDLQAQLDAAKAELEAIYTCENGGPCTALGDNAEALSALSDAYCDWLFGCCEAREVQTAVAPHFETAADCKATYADMINRGYSQFELYHSGVAYGFSENVSQWLQYASVTSDAIDEGRIQIDMAKLDACADYISGFACADTESDPAACGETSENPCDEIYIGVQGEGEPCSTSGGPTECMEGLICGYGSGYQDGICIPEPEAGDPCIDDGDCSTNTSSLYCDELEGTCKTRPGAGDDCEFVDPNFKNVGYSLKVPCQPGLQCSVQTSTCVSPCEEGALCSGYPAYPPSYNDCPEGLTCQVTPYEDTLLNPSYIYSYDYGHCGTPGTKGQVRTLGLECASGGLYYDAPDYRCTGVGGESCTLASECASGVCDTTCAQYCGPGFEDSCSNGEYCSSGNACLPLKSNATVCVYDDECTSGICHAGECSGTVSTGADCENDDDLCLADSTCEYTGATTSGYACVQLADKGEDCTVAQCGPGLTCVDSVCENTYGREDGVGCYYWYDCASERCDYDSGLCVSGGKAEGVACSAAAPWSTVSLNTNAAYDECAKGLFCKRNAPGDAEDFSGVCTTQLSEGSFCDRSLNSNTKQCAGNQSCSYTASTHGEYVCPVFYTDESEGLSCTLSYIPSVSAPWL